MKGEPAVYHVLSRTALDGFVLSDVEKDYLLKFIKRLSRGYFAEVIGFCFTPLNLCCLYLSGIFLSQKNALHQREKYLKTWHSKQFIQKRLKPSIFY